MGRGLSDKIPGVHRILILTQYRILLYSVKDFAKIVKEFSQESSNDSRPVSTQGSKDKSPDTTIDILGNQTVSLHFQ